MEGTTGSLVEELTSSKLHRETKLKKKRKRKINHLDLIDIQRARLQHLMKTHSFLMKCGTSTKIDHILDNLKSLNKFKSNEII